MSLMPLIMGGSGGDPGNTVQILSNDFLTQGFSSTVFSGVKFDSDGNMYERQEAGGWSSIGAWLLNGTASDFYIYRSITAGNLTTDSGGVLGTPVQLNTDRTYDIQRTTDGEKEATVDFVISDQADGTPILANKSLSFFLIKGLP